jgi:hypothetical protein
LQLSAGVGACLQTAEHRRRLRRAIDITKAKQYPLSADFVWTSVLCPTDASSRHRAPARIAAAKAQIVLSLRPPALSKQDRAEHAMPDHAARSAVRALGQRQKQLGERKGFLNLPWQLV